MAWRFVVGDWDSTPSIALTRARARRVTWRLDAPADAAFTIDGRTEQAAAITELVSDLWVYRDGDLVFRGRIGATGDEITDKAHTCNMTAGDYRALLDSRILYDDDVLDFGDPVPVEQSDIAWALVEGTQARTAGDLGIVRGVGAVTGIERERHYEAGKHVGEAIAQLGRVIDGFEWSIDVADTDDDTPTLNVWYPNRGTDREVVLSLHESRPGRSGGGNVARVRRAVDPTGYGNAGRWSGTTGLVAEPREAADLATRPEGRFDVQIGQPDVLEQATLEEKADQGIEDVQVLAPAYVVQLRQGVWGGPGHVWLGDPVRLLVSSGRLELDASYRVLEVMAAPDESGGEVISLAVGAPTPTFTDRLPDLGRRVENLERR